MMKVSLCTTVLLLLLGAHTVLCGQYITYSYSSRANGLWIPSKSGTAPLPLFVMLHGCTQDPASFAAGTNMNSYCDTYNCFVLYPQQPTSANSNKCWNWFEPKDQARGSGEPLLLVNMAQSLFSKYNIDTSRIFVGGLSAGAAMSVILGATYPDFFRGAAVGAGLEFVAATSVINALTAMQSGGPNPVTQGKLAYNAAGNNNHKLLPIFVVHGSSDTTVAPVNGKQVVSQFATTLDYTLGNGTSKGYLTDTPTTTTNGQVTNGRSYTTYTYADKLYGRTMIIYVVVNGMVHAWSGGSASGSYTDPKGPNASVMMIEYFYSFTNGTTPTTTTTTTSSSSSSSSSTTYTTSTSASSSGTITGTGTGITSTISTTTTTITSGTTSTTGGGGNTVYFTSIAGEDGFVGKLAANGFSASVCQIGDEGMYNIDTYRTILSFDTTSLPPSGASIITEAILKINEVAMTGSLKPLIVDIKSGTFGPTSNLQQSAYYGVPSSLNIGSIQIPNGAGAASGFSIPSSALQYVVAGANGRCQIMLREDPTNPISFAQNLLTIVDGGATLAVTYS